jgi:hypothetical protein
MVEIGAVGGSMLPSALMKMVPASCAKQILFNGIIEKQRTIEQSNTSLN